MFVTVALVTVVTLLLLLLRFFRHKEIDLSHIPGPSYNPWLQLFRRVDTDRTHVMLQDAAKHYGPVMKIPDLGTDILIVSGFDEIYQMLVKEGVVFGGRPTFFRFKATLGETGILHNLEPDAKWKTLRKITQQHLRQFSDGMSKIEDIVLDIANNMFSDFENNANQSYDPQDIVYESAFANIASLIIGGETENDQIWKKMKQYTTLFFDINKLDASASLLVMDVFPWLQHVRWPAMKLIERYNQLEVDIWKYAKNYAQENPEASSISSAFDGHPGLEEKDAIKSTMLLLFAGVTTTSHTFYGMINLFAHNRKVQNKIFGEIEKIQHETGKEISLQDRASMSYARAVLLETLRFTTVAAFGANHRCLQDVQLGGFKIPANTHILISLWALHHDEDFWNEPYSFKPDRFLDDQGELVPADHPNRKHLMPFGAGTRVCVGESLAMARLFLWMVNLVQRFEISPAPGNKENSTDPRSYYFVGQLKPRSYEVVFTKRK